MVESINPQKLHQELKTADLPVVSVSSSGRIDYSRSLTTTERTTANQIIANHDPIVSDSDVFIEKLKAASISRDDVLFALWKSVSEGEDLNKDRLTKIINQF